MLRSGVSETGQDDWQIQDFSKLYLKRNIEGTNRQTDGHYSAAHATYYHCASMISFIVTMTKHKCDLLCVFACLQVSSKLDFNFQLFFISLFFFYLLLNNSTVSICSDIIFVLQVTRFFSLSPNSNNLTWIINHSQRLQWRHHISEKAITFRFIPQELSKIVTLICQQPAGANQHSHPDGISELGNTNERERKESF